MFVIKKFKPKMDSYDEVHEVKNSRDIATPPNNLDKDVEKNGSIQFVHSEDDDDDMKDIDKKIALDIKVRHF